ncbi:MAG: hypothetical protein AB8V10_00240 [Francisella endosymbiont of Hyalomma asiaticum]
MFGNIICLIIEIITKPSDTAILLIYDAIFFTAIMQQFYNHSSYIVNRLSHQLTKLKWFLYLAIQLSLIMSIYLMIYRFEEYRNTLVTYYQQNNVSEPVLPMLSEYSQIMFINDITLDENTYK